MVEPEVACNDSDDNMRLQEAFVSYIVARALERRQRGAEGAGARHRAARAGRRRPFPGSPTPTRSRGSSSWAPTSSGATTSGATTRRCWPRSTTGRSSSSTTPRQAKAFYMKENPDDPRTVLNNDCLAPEGYGEIIGGSQREDDYDKLLGADPRAGARSRGLRLVPRPAEVRHVRALGVRARPRADGGLDLRHPAHPRGDRVSRGRSSAVPVAPVIERSEDLLREHRPLLDDPRCARLTLGLFHLIPEPVQHFQPRRIDIDPALRRQRFHRFEAVPELYGWPGRAPARAGRPPSAPG